MPGIRVPYTDRYGTLHPNAWVEIVRMHVELRPEGFASDYQLNIHHDQQSRQNGLPPFEERPMKAMTDTEIQTLVAQFTPAMYGILVQHPEFSGAQIIVP